MDVVADPVATGFLAAGSFWFWVLLVLANILMFASVEKGDSAFATICVIVFFCMLQWWGDIKVFTYVAQNPWLGILYFFEYFAVGTVWFIGKWISYVWSRKRKYNELRQVFCEEKGISPDELIPNNHKAAWDTAKKVLGTIPPKISQHKNDAYMWIAAWPWSFAWTIINDPVRRTIQFIYRKLAGAMQDISNAAFAGTD